MDYEIRNMKAELRAEDPKDEPKVIRGYFAVFDSGTELYPKVFEKIDRNAFEKSLIENDVRALTNHDSSLVLGRTKSGSLKLRTDEKGLYGEILINEDDQEAVNLYARVKRGDVDQCSFGFIVRAEENDWQDDVLRTTLTDVDLLEVSCVTFPAYKDTAISARSKERIENAKDKYLAEQRNKLKEKFSWL